MSKRSGFFSYFTTPAGKKLVFFAVNATTACLFMGHFVPQTIGIKYYLKLFQCYKNGSERPVPEKLQKRFEVAKEKLNLKPYEHKFLEPFMVYGFDVLQAGYTKSRFGAKLGIPVNYEYDNVNDIEKDEIRFRDEPINWNSASGALLENAIVLNEDEQIFALCKSILEVRNFNLFLNSVFPPISLWMVYAIGQYLNMRLDLFTKHLSVRLVLYTILGLFGLGLWFFLKDFNQVITDGGIDKQLCSLGPTFMEAGVQYYDKILKKNICLRNLIGDDTYTALGNENYLLRQKSLPLTIRKSFFEEKLREFHRGEEQLQ